jgi:tripartite-type tricarboxylate transporter receptor subunit TctC
VLPALQAEPSAVAVRKDSRFKTLKELVDDMRANPDKLSVGGFSSGGFHQFVFYRLQQEGKFKGTWIPFKGGQEAGMALLGGHIDVSVLTPSSALSPIRSFPTCRPSGSRATMSSSASGAASWSRPARRGRSSRR